MSRSEAHHVTTPRTGVYRQPPQPPTCSGWTLADLGEHTRWVHRWATHAITDGNPNGDSPAVATDLRRTIVLEPDAPGDPSSSRHPPPTCC